jgi:hypothetical protein
VTSGPLQDGQTLRDRQTAGEAIAGLLAAFALFVSLVALAYRPMRLIPAAVVLSLTAAAIGGRYSKLTALSVGAVALCWLVGVTIAVVTKNPLF